MFVKLIIGVLNLVASVIEGEDVEKSADEKALDWEVARIRIETVDERS